jgi:transglutaminase-like putative cysteine protease
LRPLLLTLLLLAPAALASDTVLFRAAPPWTDRLDVSDNRPPADVRNGIWALLTDHQIKVDGGRVTDYHRRVRKVLTPAGVQDAAELSIDFDPTYETLVIHDAAVLRDGKRVGGLNRSEVRVIEKEPESDDRIYDGQLTALAFLADVRPGDVIDYSWSLVGANPLLGGKYADELDLSVTLPTRHLRHRLLWPAGRPLQIRSTLAGLQPKIANGAYVWEREDVAPLDDEDETPSWFDPFDVVQVTEFRSWNEVAQWAAALYRPEPASLAAVREIAARIRREQTTDEARITAAIRFVQDDIRYLGIEMGRNSHEPHQPATTLAQRYGDCKDKAFLLCLLLRELGIEARPAMVNTKLRRRLDDYLPSPFVFDHVIAEVVRGKQTSWIDGTIANQGGLLSTIETPSDERALVIDAGTVALAHIGTREKGGVVVEQTYDVPEEAKPATMEVVATYRGRDADDLRARLATASLADIGREHLNRYAADQPRIEPMGAPTVQDDRDANVIVLRERYRIRDLFTNGAFSYVPRAVSLFLARPETKIRSTPLRFDYPLDITERATFRLPRSVAREQRREERESPAFHFERQVESSGRKVILTYRLRARRDSIAVADVPKHLTTLNDISDHLSYSVAPQQPVLASFAAVTWSWPWLAIVALAVLLTWTLQRVVTSAAGRSRDGN